MEPRSAAGADTQIYAIGLDVGGMALEVAQRGFSSMLSNRMSQLGRWSFDGPRPALRLADDLVSHLLQRERASRFERAAIGTAVPVWLGIHERSDLADVIDERRRHTLVACTSTVAAAVGTNLAGDTPLRSEFVLSLDVEVGFSASIVEIGIASVHEWCSVGLSPQRLRGENVGLGIVSGARQRDRALAELHREATELGCVDVDRIVAVGEETVDVIKTMLAGVTQAWAMCPIEVARGRSAVARGAAVLADPPGGLDVFEVGRATTAPAPPVAPIVAGAAAGSAKSDPDDAGGGRADAQVPADDGSDDAAGSRLEWVVTGTLGRRIGVLMENRDGVPVVHPVVERGAEVPSVHEQLFDLGPDDGSEVYLDLYEQTELSLSDDPKGHRIVATAELRFGVRRRPEVAVTFETGADGRFSVGPPDMWALAWHPAEVAVLAVHRHMVDPPSESGADRVMVRPLIASWAVTPVESTPGVDDDERIDQDDAPVIEDDAHVHQVPTISEPEARGEHGVEVPGVVRVTKSLGRAEMPPSRPLPLLPTPAIAAALQRCERLLSYEVGQMVAVRSVFALLDCADDASLEAVEAAASRLEGSMSGRDDDLADAIREAVSATRRLIADGGEDWYFGGTLADVDAEVGRVVEHLMVVVGLVSPAEQRRLVHDAELLGLGPEGAHRLVRDLVLRAQEDRFQTPLNADDDVRRTVHLHPQLSRFVLDGPADGADRAAVRLRVLLDIR